MKRKIHHIFIIFLTSLSLIALSSCRSSKKSKSEFYDAQIEKLNNGKKDNDKNGNHDKGVSSERKKIIKEANTWLGTPYGYGKAQKGVACDCSGMVMSVYEKVTGVKLPRNSAKQSEFCKKIRKKDVLPADLCFFATGKDPNKISHVGIMIDDKKFIHASTSKGVVISDITQPYYVRTFICFGRVPQ